MLVVMLMHFGIKHAIILYFGTASNARLEAKPSHKLCVATSSSNCLD